MTQEISSKKATTSKTQFKRLKPHFPSGAFIKMVLKLMLPLVLGQIIISSVNFIDNFIVGHTKDYEVNLAAIAIANEIWYCTMGLVWAVSVGTSIFLAQYYGANKIDNFKKLTKNMILMNLVLTSICFALAMTIPHKIMHIYTHDERVVSAGTDYLKWIMADMIFIAISYSFQSTFNVMGKTRYVIVSASVALVNNGVMGYVFIYPLDMGCEGAGIANFISRFFEISLMLFFAFKNRQQVFWSLKLYFDFVMLRQVMGKWYYMIAYLASIVSYSALTAVWSNFYSTQAVSAVGVAYAVSNIMWTIFPGISAASKVLIGQELGRKDFDTALLNSRRLNVTIMYFSVVVSIIGVCIAMFLPQVVGLKGQARLYARDMILIYSGANTFYVITNTFFSALETGGVTIPSTICSSCFQLLINLPLAILLSKLSGLDFISVFAITQCTQIIPALLSYYYYRKFNWLNNVTG